MIRIEKAPLATAILYLLAKAKPGSPLRNEDLARLMMDSELSVMQTGGKFQEHFVATFKERPYLRENPCSLVLSLLPILPKDDVDARKAAYAIIHQMPRQELDKAGVAECVFHGKELMAVRNYGAMLTEPHAPEIRSIRVRLFEVPSPVPTWQAIDAFVYANTDVVRKRLEQP